MFIVTKHAWMSQQVAVIKSIRHARSLLIRPVVSLGRHCPCLTLNNYNLFYLLLTLIKYYLT